MRALAANEVFDEACERSTFGEALPGIARRHSRYSERSRDILRQIGIALGGEPALVSLAVLVCRQVRTA